VTRARLSAQPATSNAGPTEALRAVAYARYSSDEQNARSLDDQIAQSRLYAERNGHPMVDTFSDAASSGTHVERPALQRLLAAASAKRRTFDLVIVDDLSRLSRHMGNFWMIVDELASLGIVCVEVMSGIRSDHPSARALYGMKAMIADQFVATLRYQTRRGLYARARDGFAAGGRKYGYRLVDEPHPSDPKRPRKLWTVHEPEAQIVRAMFAWRADGCGYRMIARKLGAAGTPPSENGANRRKYGRPAWTYDLVESILCNPIYVGELQYGRTRTERDPRTGRRRRRDGDERVVRAAPELAIVDRALWDRVRARDRAPRDPRDERLGAIARPLTGLVRCGLCGGTMAASTITLKSGAKKTYYKCLGRAKTPACDNGSTFVESSVLAALAGALREVLSTPERRAAFERGFKRGAKLPENTAERARLEKQLAKISKRIENATRELLDDPSDLAIRKARDADRREELRLTCELAEAGKVVALDAMAPPTDTIARAARRLADLMADAKSVPEVRDALLACMGPIVCMPTTPRDFADGSRKPAGSRDNTPRYTFRAEFRPLGFVTSRGAATLQP
jgi:DNA invertase Pin-like site-specific DNA recombinase